MNSQTLTLNQKSKAKTSQFDIAKFFSQEKVKKALLKIGVTVLILGLLIGGYANFAYAYADKIYPKVTIGGTKVGGLTQEQAKQIIDEKIQTLNNNGPEITYNDQTVKPTLNELGLNFDSAALTKQAFDFGRTGSFKERVSESYKLARSGLQIEITPQIDEEKFNEYLSQLASVIEKEPVNASLEIKNGQIVTIEPENGRGLDKDKLKEDLTAIINSDNTNGQIVTQTSDLKPQIQLEGTIAAKTQAEQFLAAAPIAVTFENSAWVADKAEIGSWIDFSISGDKLAAHANPRAFIESITDQVDIPTKDREVQDGTGAVLNEGQDGRGTDTQTLMAQINDALAKGQPGTFALGTYLVPRGEKIIYPHAQPGRYAGRYIDINLSEQTLYAFEGSTLVNQFLVSTGKRGYATPTGEFHVYGKDRSALMDGEDYYLPNVPYISWFSGDYSIHGTYWHSNFGHTMSHGCVNMATPDAEWIFNWDDIGTPVYIHY